MVDLRYVGASRSVSFGLHLWHSHPHARPTGEQVKRGSTEQTPTLGIAEFNAVHQRPPAINGEIPPQARKSVPNTTWQDFEAVMTSRSLMSTRPRVPCRLARVSDGELTLPAAGAVGAIGTAFVSRA